MGAFTDENPRTALECSHGFHASCIIDWFRSAPRNNTCPLCRAEPSTVLSYPDTMTRCTILRRKARAKDAPPELKHRVAQIQKAEHTLTQRKQEWRDFCTPDIKAILSTYRALTRKRWTALRAVHKAKRELGLSSFPDLCAMPMARTPYLPSLFR